MPKLTVVPKFTMEFELTTIEHLGVKLYGTLPPVIGELVSNAWDAEAGAVSVTFPTDEITESSEVIVRDFGDYAGMDANALQSAYLPIGRNRRNELATDITPNLKRHVMGRKGLGKLSAFGIADELQIRTIQNGYAICILLSYEEMKGWPAKKPYEPKSITELSGPTKDKNGTEITIRKLRRKKGIDQKWIKMELARRFTIIDKRKFSVTVNDEPILPEDRRLREMCHTAWDVTELPQGNVVSSDEDWRVSGWVGLVNRSSSVDRGVDIFANGKSVELDTMFGMKSTNAQFANAYIVGEVHADFLDEEDDNIATGRNMAQWESDSGLALQAWGLGVIKFVQNKWLERQRQQKEDRVMQTPGFQEWLASRMSREQAAAKKMVKIIVDDQNIEPEAAASLLEIVKSNIEFRAFQDLIDEIEEKKLGIESILRLVSDWRVFEAREHLRLADGRMGIINQLAEYMKYGALEVQQVQPLFEENGWLVNPTWGNVSGQNRYTDLIRRHCKEKPGGNEKDRRIDIVGYEIGGVLEIVEIKRPEKKLHKDDLRQIEDYVEWGRANLIGTGEDTVSAVRGRLIIGSYSDDVQTKNLMMKLAGDDIRTETYRDIVNRSEKIHGEAEQNLRKIAPEYFEGRATKVGGAKKKTPRVRADSHRKSTPKKPPGGKRRNAKK